MTTARRSRTWLKSPIADEGQGVKKMLEILYRIYEVADEETAKINRELDIGFGVYSSTSKAENIELLMDCLICDSREQFKEIIKAEYGENIAFRYSKKMKAGELYCIIIGEHCYNTERYFNKTSFECDCCGATVEGYFNKSIHFSDWEINCHLFGIQEYAEKRFCSNRCKTVYEDKELARLRPDDDQEFYVSRDMFTEDINGYVYKISKKSTGEFYVGQTKYAPVFRWGQHLKTWRFPIKDITDYKFEVIEIVPKMTNILEREKHWIQTLYKENPEKSLNIACTAGLSDQGQITIDNEMEGEDTE